MNGKTAKEIRNHMYYPKQRKYYRDKNGTIHADKPRKEYQAAKKKALEVKRNK